MSFFMKTVFEEDLNSFLYSDTCEKAAYDFLKEALGVILNNTQGEKSKFNLKKFAQKAALLIAPIVVASTFIVASSGSPPPDKVKERLRAYAVTPERLDEKSRDDLVGKLAETRDYFGFTQKELADLLSVSESTISKMERGEHYPDYKSLDKYNQFFELTDYVKAKLKAKKYAIRQLFHMESKLFGDMTAIEFSKVVGDEGLNEVMSLLKRQYG